MKKLYFLRGLPASGKTTWAKKKLATLNRDGVRRAVRTNKDEIRKRLRAKGINSETRVIRRETELVTKAMKAGLQVVIDNTHFHPPHELRYRQLADEYGYKFEIKSFTHVSVEACVRRDLKRRNSVGEWVIRDMHSKYLSQGVNEQQEKNVMRALLIRSPHIEKILEGKKIWEIRGSRTDVREQVGLVRSGSGTIIGVCDVVDCIPILTDEQFRRNARKAGSKPSEVSLGHYKNTFAWVLANPQYLKAPVPYKHPTGAIIWVKLDAQVEKAVQRAVKH
jgi:predicted kinase